MKANIEIDLKPFTVPNYVSVKQEPGLKQDGLQEAKNYHVSELSVETLSKMCDVFRKDVFRKAGKLIPSPPTTE